MRTITLQQSDAINLMSQSEKQQQQYTESH